MIFKTFKQLCQYIKLLWRVKMYKIQLMKLDTKRLKALCEIYETYTYATDHPDILELMKKNSVNKQDWYEFVGDMCKMKNLDTIIKDFWRETNDSRESN